MNFPRSYFCSNTSLYSSYNLTTSSSEQFFKLMTEPVSVESEDTNFARSIPRFKLAIIKQVRMKQVLTFQAGSDPSHSFTELSLFSNNIWAATMLDLFA